MTVEAIDFSRSFLWWRIDTDMVPPGTITVPPPYALNNARVPLDCLCTITAPGGLVRRRFALGTSCKTEAVGAERDIWPQPNADFIPVLSDDGEVLGIKTYETAGRQIAFHLSDRGLQSERQVSQVADVYEGAVEAPTTRRSCSGRMCSTLPSRAWRRVDVSPPSSGMGRGAGGAPAAGTAPGAGRTCAHSHRRG